MADADSLCERCDDREIEVNCSCGAGFCEHCFSNKHLVRHPTHRKGGSRKDEEKWKWITGRFSGIKSLAEQFKDDEDAKWFGLHADWVNGAYHVSIVETERLTNTMAASLTYYDVEDIPKRQFPSIASFIGETGAGKSTLVRSMICNSERAKEFDHLEAPVPGADSGGTKSTTGEVNLYPDPTTFGSESPVFYVDCEGIMGASDPLSAGHQTRWIKDATSRRYPIAVKNGERMDRRTAVKELYPRFLYIFSDVVCYVTGNPRAWAESAVHLLGWSLAGAQSSINQHALPALIIALNAPKMDRRDWIEGDPDAATKAFFETIEGEIAKNNFVMELAKQYGSKTMAELFSLSYSSVYVHYIPLKGYEYCGSTQTVVQQTGKLSHRIRSDAERVQAARAAAWTRFDTKQLSVLVGSAFRHLASGRKGPFDFSRCRERLSVPNSTEEHFSRILGHCLQNRTEERFEKMAMVMASSLLRHTIHEEKSDTGVPLTPATVFNQDIRSICDRAMSKFLDDSAQCGFVNPSDGRRCVNTKIGHAQGHQDRTGVCLRPGLFVSGRFDTQSFLALIEKSVRELMKKIDRSRTLSPLDWRRGAAVAHRDNLRLLRESGGFPWTKGGSQTVCNNFAKNSSVCYACFFGRPEYKLPCGHAICAECLEDFDQTLDTSETPYPGIFTHNKCIICTACTGPGWPYRMHVKPRLAGVRVLSLDGGGVRGVVELVVLRELENKIGLGIPIGRFFDYIIGTSAGGIISLGIGIQELSAGACLNRFHEFTRTGFTKKWMNKTKLFRPLGRLIRSSTYSTPELERAFQTAFRPNTTQDVFGMQNSRRVAVTTTVNNELRLIANYNRGDANRYLQSDQLAIWKAARSTSAAPMFFERAHHAGNECWDGGLKANNPVTEAVTETKTIWGEDVDFDLLLSIGSGHARVPIKQPHLGTSSGWLTSLLKAMLASMDGESTWIGFRPEARVRDRAVRLNVELSGSSQPSLDDVAKVPEMQTAAQNYAHHNGEENRFRVSPLSPLAGKVSSDMLLCLAGRLRASLFFFEMEWVNIKKGLAVFGGSICCRLTPDDKGFDVLMNYTQAFTVAENQIPLEPRTQGTSAPFRMPVYFGWDPESKKPARIDVHFGQKGKEISRSQYAVSGFPAMASSLLEYGRMHSDSYVKVTQGLSRGSINHSSSKAKRDSAVSVSSLTRSSLVDEGVARAEDDMPQPPRYSDVVLGAEGGGY